MREMEEIGGRGRVEVEGSQKKKTKKKRRETEEDRYREPCATRLQVLALLQAAEPEGTG